MRGALFYSSQNCDLYVLEPTARLSAFSAQFPLPFFQSRDICRLSTAYCSARPDHHHLSLPGVSLSHNTDGYLRHLTNCYFLLLLLRHSGARNPVLGADSGDVIRSKEQSGRQRASASCAVAILQNEPRRRASRPHSSTPPPSDRDSDCRLLTLLARYDASIEPVLCFRYRGPQGLHLLEDGQTDAFVWKITDDSSGRSQFSTRTSYTSHIHTRQNHT